MRGRRSGQTLIELLIVVAIMLIVISMIFVTFRSLYHAVMSLKGG